MPIGFTGTPAPPQGPPPPSPPAPQAGFNVDNLSGVAPHTINITSTATGVIDSIAYDLNGDSIIDSSGIPNLQYTYQTAGAYVATQTVANAGGQSTAQRTITVTEPPPPPSPPTDVDFTFTPTSVETGAPVNFTGIATGATTHAWTFPTGTPASSTQQNPQGVTFGTAGTKNVAYTPSNASGPGPTVTKPIVVNVPPPPPPNPPTGVDFTGNPTNGVGPLSVDFTSGGSNIASRAWTFQNGTPATSTVQNPTGISFPTAGSPHDVTLVATAPDGSQVTVAKPAYITVTAAPPPAPLFAPPWREVPGNGTLLAGRGWFAGCKVNGTSGPIRVYDGFNANGTLLLDIAAPVSGQWYYVSTVNNVVTGVPTSASRVSWRFCSTVFVTQGSTSQVLSGLYDNLLTQ